MKGLTRHLPHYISLLGILLAGALGFVLFSYDKTFQVIISTSVAASYVIWGIVHHKIHRDFELAILIEYFAVATLGLIVVFSLIFRL